MLSTFYHFLSEIFSEALRLSDGLGLRIHITTKIKEIVKKQNFDASNKYGW